MSETRIKLAFIGCGDIATAHWDGIERIAKRADVTAVVDKNPTAVEAMSKLTGATIFRNIHDALEHGDFIAADIMLPHDQHEFAALACFNAGKHVLLEKPIAHTLESAKKILRASSQTDIVFMIAEQSQYWPDIIEARKLIDQGAIGEVISASGTYYDRVSRDLSGPIPWRYRLEAAGGGVTLDGGAHWIRPLRMMMGEVSEVIGISGNHIAEMEGESWSRMLLRFENNAVGVLTCHNFLCPSAPPELFRITGTKGELLITGGRDGRLSLYNSEFPRGKAVLYGAEGRRDSYGAEINEFCDLILNGGSMTATPEYSLGELCTAKALYKSIETKRWEKVW